MSGDLINDYQVFVKNRLNKPVNYDSNMEVLLGLATEVGELLDIYKKNIRYGTSIDKTGVIAELGDILFYLIGVMNILDSTITLEKVMRYNITKLTLRDLRVKQESSE